MSAALMLHIFQKYSERIRLCNLVQTINVLQSIILTEGAKMVKTPTYHLFDLFKKHQDANYIPVSWDEKPETIQMGLPNVDMSASTAENGKVFVTIVNLSAEKKAGVVLNFAALKAVRANGRLMSGEVTAHNTFDNPEIVHVEEQVDIHIANGEVALNLPACAIAAVEVELG
jgi:alpha-N-arabinofuranosidase